MGMPSLIFRYSYIGCTIDQLYNFVWAQKNYSNYSNFTITFPMIWRYAVDFFKVLLKFNMTATYQLHNFFCGQINYSNLSITFLIICRCVYDFFKVLLKFKIVATNPLLIICGRKNSKPSLWWGDAIGLHGAC